ncbi:MAG: hypothetical protein ABT01_04260 [Clostridium sp. SCN 57-10]|nr:MAG: hypothetical protein ABT01_04260 [Clostridium sp. SCN 57-10]
MSKRTDREIEARLARAVDALLPDLCAQAASAPLHTSSAEADVISFSSPVRSAPLIRRVAAACACAVLLCAAGAFSLLCPAAYIGIDVNPSIELTTNLFDRVLTATARNADAEEVLSGLRLRNVDLDTAVSAIIGSIVQHEYLKNGEGEIRITVQSGSGNRAVRLEERLVDDVRRALPVEQQRVSVYTETDRPLPTESTSAVSTEPTTRPTTVPGGADDDRTAPTKPSKPSGNHGKKALIDCILALDPSRDAAVLQRMSTEKLRELQEDLLDNDEIEAEDREDETPSGQKEHADNLGGKDKDKSKDKHEGEDDHEDDHEDDDD